MKLIARLSSGAAVLFAGALMLSACSSGGATDAAEEAVDVSDVAGEAPAGAGSDDSGSSTTYPLTVQNCDAEVVFDEAPEQVLMLSSAPVTILDGIGVFDRVFMKAGNYPAEIL